MNTQKSTDSKGVELEHLSWLEAEKQLTRRPVVVVPLGGQLKEHGPHLPLNNDWILAEYLKKEVLSRLEVIATPTINFNCYPAMADYPGTVSLRPATATSLTVDICSSLARFGPTSFYVLNTGISTIKPLQAAQDIMAKSGLTLAYTDLRSALREVREAVEEQEGGTHADEIETSIMLYIAPHVVNMSAAVKDYTGTGSGPLRPEDDGTGIYSPTGTWGDPTLATQEKGERLTGALIEFIIDEIRALSTRDSG